MINTQIVDQKTMEAFFNSHLDLFAGARKLIDLKIFQHDPSLVISHDVTLVKYKLQLEYKAGEIKTAVLRGSSDPKEKRLKSYKILKVLWETGFNEGHFVVPKPLGYFPEYKLLLYENYPALSLMQRLESGQNHFMEKIQSSLEWLAAFHENQAFPVSEIPADPKQTQEDEQRLTAALCKKFPQQAERIKAVVEAVANTEKNLLDPSKFVLVHGDFQPNNILIGDGQITVIDFNDALIYDELFDIEYFVTQTEYIYKRCRGSNIADQLDLLKIDYLKNRKIPQGDLTRKKLALFRAKTLLRIKILTSHPIGEKILDEIEDNAKKAA